MENRKYRLASSGDRRTSSRTRTRSNQNKFILERNVKISKLWNNDGQTHQQAGSGRKLEIRLGVHGITARIIKQNYHRTRIGEKKQAKGLACQRARANKPSPYMSKEQLLLFIHSGYISDIISYTIVYVHRF